jgi:septum formation protein
MGSHPPLPRFELILCSASPRRRQLLQGLDLPVTITQADVDETPPEGMPAEDVAEHLARLKAAAWKGALGPQQVLIAADTTVLIDHHLLNKPEDAADAMRMLALLSGRTHRVITGVCLRTASGLRSFADVALVTFRTLSAEEIAYYVEQHRPFDKAGAYGVQDWIGYTAVSRVEGSFYTVMGLPMHRVYEELLALQA